MERRTIKPINFPRALLDEYVEIRIKGTRARSHPFFKKSANKLWEFTNGSINQSNWKELHKTETTEYQHETQIKFFGFLKSFLKWLERDHEIEIKWYVDTLVPVKDTETKEPPSIDIEDIRKVLSMLDRIKLREKGKNEVYKAMVLFQAYTGQRPEFITRLTVKQVKEITEGKIHVIKVEPSQDKQGIRTGKSHLVAIHPRLMNILKELVKGREDLDSPLFGEKLYDSINKVFQKHPVPNISKSNLKFNLGHCRKFFQQQSTKIGFVGEHRNYMMMHDIKGVIWDHYESIAPEDLYNNYIEKWGKVNIEITSQSKEIVGASEALESNNIQEVISPEEQRNREKIYIAYLRKKYGDEKAEEYILSENIKAYKEWQDEESKRAYEDQIKEEEEWSRGYDAEI